MSCLHFAKFNGRFDIAIKGHGYDLLVSQVNVACVLTFSVLSHSKTPLGVQVANTVLKGPNVGKNIPTVAEMTQGEVRCS